MMFAGWGGGAPGNYDDPNEKERNPPKRPVDVQFPAYRPAARFTPLDAKKHGYLKKTLTAIRRPEDISPDLIEQFNIRYQFDVPFEDLVPSQPGSVMHQAQLEAILADEISCDNVDCYRKVCRLQPLDPSKPLPRLAQTHLFFKGLEDMSRFWDSSQDNYYEIADPAAAVKDTTETTQSSSTSISESPKPNANHHTNTVTDTNTYTSVEDSTIPSPEASIPTKPVYKGRRLGNATDMPEDYREQTIEGFLRAITWKFNSAAKRPNIQPRLLIGNVMFPVRHNHIVGRVPKDRQLARSGHLEGPILASSCRGEVSFRTEGEEVGRGRGEVVDFMRELGGVLLLAQQRRREGMVEVKPGEGEWWTTEKRWGGGDGGKMPHEVLEDACPVVSITPDMKRKDEGGVEKGEGLENGKGKEIEIPMANTTTTANSTKAAVADDPNAWASVVAPEEKGGGEENTISTGTPTNPSEAALKPASPLEEKNLDTATNTQNKSSRPATIPLTSTSKQLFSAPRKRTSSNSNPQQPPSRRPPPRMATFAQRWKEMVSPVGIWDGKMRYEAIGKEKGARGITDNVIFGGDEWDDVYMLSCVNSSVSVLRMRVSRGYMRWLEGKGTGNGEGEGEAQGKGWTKGGKEEQILHLQRSKWFDLFKREERREAFKGMWGVFGWLLREGV